MANLLYDEAGVQNTIICLNNASSMLDGTSGAINSAISTINNAKNIHWLGGLDFSFALNAVAEGQSSIDENITELRNRSSYILNYSNDGNSGNTFSEIADFAARMGERFVEFNKKALEATGAVVGLGISLFGDSLSDLGDLLNKIGDKISGKDVGCKVGSAASILDERLKKIREEEERRRQLEEEERHRIEEGISGHGSGIGNDHIDAMRDRQLEEERRRIEEQQRMEEEQRRIAEEQARGQGKMPGVATVIPGGGSSSGGMDIGIKNGNSAVGRASGVGAATGGVASAAGGMDIGIKNGNSAVGRASGIGAATGGAASAAGGMDIGIKNGNSAVGRASGVGAATGGAASASGGSSMVGGGSISSGGNVGYHYGGH